MFTKLLFACVLYVVCESASYDQSQMGKLNVQVDLKDFRIFALMKGGKEEYVDYDYAYDYSEMTIKPQNGTTPKPLNVTNITTSNSTSLDKVNATASTTTDAVLLESTTAVTQKYTSFNAETTTASVNTSTPAAEPVSPENNAEVQNTNSTPINTNSTLNNGGCKKGFVVNQKGDCELKIPNGAGGNALLKLVKLSQKLKLRREKRSVISRS